MNIQDLIIPPPSPKMLDYPGTIGIGIEVLFVAILLFVSSKFDVTGGQLTISLLIVLSFVGVVVFCLFYTVPSDESTSLVIGGLVAAMGAVVTHWLSQRRPPP
jgi:uncharacterized BrkB/YihY/UPF0761 family membrane protein